MSAISHTRTEQATLWNGTAGQAWIDAQDVLDQMFGPFEALLVDEVATASAKRVLDVGCGTGSTTLAIAEQLGRTGFCSGIDISEPMIATACARAESQGSLARFIVGDAQDQVLETAGFDMIVSRFGVMFFDDPVAAFANLRSAASAGAELRAVACAPLLPELPRAAPLGRDSSHLPTRGMRGAFSKRGIHGVGAGVLYNRLS